MSLNQNITTRYNRAHGIKLKKIYWGIYNNTEYANTAFDHNCLPTQTAAAGVVTWAPTKLQSFYTMINNMRTSQYDYRICDSTAFYGDDWTVKKTSLKDANIWSSNEYYYNWVWIEDFTDNNSLLYKNFSELSANTIDGLNLTNEIKYDVNANCANGTYNHYVYAVTERLLTISHDIQVS